MTWCLYIPSPIQFLLRRVRQHYHRIFLEPFSSADIGVRLLRFSRLLYTPSLESVNKYICTLSIFKWRPNITVTIYHLFRNAVPSSRNTTVIAMVLMTEVPYNRFFFHQFAQCFLLHNRPWFCRSDWLLSWCWRWVVTFVVSGIEVNCAVIIIFVGPRIIVFEIKTGGASSSNIHLYQQNIKIVCSFLRSFYGNF